MRSQQRAWLSCERRSLWPESAHSEQRSQTPAGTTGTRGRQEAMCVMTAGGQVKDGYFLIC